MSSPSAPSALATSEPGPYELGREPLTVVLRVPEESRARLADLARDLQQGRPGNLRLAVEGVEILRPGGVYEVHLEPPEGGSPGPSSPSFVGHIAIYSKAGTRASTRTFDVTKRIRSLPRDWPAASVRITFVPAERAGEEAGPASGPVLRFRRIALVERPQSPG
jgi:hypothetical protein